MGNDASKKTSGSRLDKEIAVLKAKTNLSEQEIRDLYEQFNMEAESGTGRMNKRQFVKFYKQVVKSDDENGSIADHAFTVFDTNHDDSISFSEFVLAATMGNKNDLHCTLDLSFALVDTSGDGYITFDEMAKFIETALKLAAGTQGVAEFASKSVAADIYKQFGLDKEQKLSKQQFIDGCKKNRDLAKIFGA